MESLEIAKGYLEKELNNPMNQFNSTWSKVIKPLIERQLKEINDKIAFLKMTPQQRCNIKMLRRMRDNADKCNKIYWAAEILNR